MIIRFVMIFLVLFVFALRADAEDSARFRRQIRAKAALALAYSEASAKARPQNFADAKAAAKSSGRPLCVIYGSDCVHLSNDLEADYVVLDLPAEPASQNRASIQARIYWYDADGWLWQLAEFASLPTSDGVRLATSKARSRIEQKKRDQPRSSTTAPPTGATTGATAAPPTGSTTPPVTVHNYTLTPTNPQTHFPLPGYLPTLQPCHA